MNTHEDFRSVIREERENLTRLSDYWNNQVKHDPSYSGDAQGRIRAAVGKTRLLLSEKFKQFETLVDQSENNTAEKEISINDLQGFWDLVLIQVHEVKEMFRNLNSTGEKPSNEVRKSAKIRNQEVDQKEQARIPSSKKKTSIDHIDQAEKKLRDLIEKDKRTSEAVNMKSKLRC